jgi:hypothetical protein
MGELAPAAARLTAMTSRPGTAFCSRLHWLRGEPRHALALQSGMSRCSRPNGLETLAA